MKRFLVTLPLVLLAACNPDQQGRCEVPNTASLGADEDLGPLMRPGDSCLRCHNPSGIAARRPFSVGGTVYATHDAAACEGVEGVKVIVTDANGKKVELVSNEVGNFYSAEPLQQPLRMAVEQGGRRVEMPGSAASGGCAYCHAWPNPVTAIGRIRAP